MMTCYVKLLSGELITLELHETENVFDALSQVYPTPEKHQMKLFREDTQEPLKPRNHSRFL